MLGDQARKSDAGKRQWHLLPINAIEQLIRVQEYGNEKYEPDSWKAVDNPIVRYTDAAIRHLMATLKGEIVDPESGLLHFAHAAVNCVFLTWFILKDRTANLAEVTPSRSRAR